MGNPFLHIYTGSTLHGNGIGVKSFGDTITIYGTVRYGSVRQGFYVMVCPLSTHFAILGAGFDGEGGQWGFHADSRTEYGRTLRWGVFQILWFRIVLAA